MGVGIYPGTEGKLQSESFTVKKDLRALSFNTIVFLLPLANGLWLSAGVILPSLERLHINFSDLPGDSVWYSNPKAIAKKNYDVEDNRFIMTNVDSEEREEECGICLEPCTKMVLPNCCHAMCIKCYRNWNTKSESCPFCRGSIKRVNSEDLWVLTCDEDVVDPETVTKEDLLRFYLHINSLPKDYPEAVFLGYNEYLI